MRDERKKIVKLVLVAILALLLAACSGAAAETTRSTATVADSGDDPTCPTEGEALDTAKVYIEHNATDADTGFHGLFGGEAWSELCIWDPDGSLIFVVDPRNQLGDLTVADLFFESREPPNDEYSLDDIRSDFPEGTYTAGGTDFEGKARVGKATFTHEIPAEPRVTSPQIGEEEDPPEVMVDGLVVAWDAVEETVFGEPLTISGYEVIVTKVEHDDPNGLSRPIYDVHVGPETLSLDIPVGFLEAATLYELEILALEWSGNQTITVGFFKTVG